MGILRAISLNLIKKVPGKRSLEGKRFKAALSERHLRTDIQTYMRKPWLAH